MMQRYKHCLMPAKTFGKHPKFLSEKGLPSRFCLFFNAKLLILS
jgi:hypothetical protein